MATWIWKDEIFYSCEIDSKMAATILDRFLSSIIHTTIDSEMAARVLDKLQF